jgi:hypothetical protein
MSPLEALVAGAALLAIAVAVRAIRRRRAQRRVEARMAELAAAVHPDAIPRAPNPPRPIRRGNRERGAIRKTRRGRWDRWA